MCKAKLAVLGFVAVSLLAFNGIATAGIVDPCMSYSEVLNAGPSGGTCCLFVCPAGDTDSFINQGPGGDGWWIRICVLEADGTPTPDVPTSDFWLVDCDPLADLVLCAGSASVAADSITNAQGYTTMAQSVLAGGGCLEGLSVVVRGFVLLDTTTCSTPICHDISVRSPDIDGSGGTSDLCVNLVDLAAFSSSYPPQPYDTCCDFDCSGAVLLNDLADFAFHFGPPGHECSPPGCP